MTTFLEKIQLLSETNLSVEDLYNSHSPQPDFEVFGFLTDIFEEEEAILVKLKGFVTLANTTQIDADDKKKIILGLIEKECAEQLSQVKRAALKKINENQHDRLTYVLNLAKLKIWFFIKNMVANE